ncbi:SH3 domain-containing protein [Tenacibaculum ovolyticum]|uniref:SH3 domain-containing protein n=1 Tax=Tenacibaculum ovolyticum TaxID=104270 RepID=UPI0022F39D19|nr:SH3 domain-containing protein [Tenacibaculum ovolyticum]WBX78221.1 SH3 domain-containing protein [Tenacibaculum ovolyticum]
MNYINKLHYIILFSFFIVVLSCKKEEINNKKTPLSVELDNKIPQNKASNTLDIINPNKWLTKKDSNNFKSISLPFTFEQFYDDYVDEANYPYYNISENLKEYLINNNFEAESYESLLVSSAYEFNIMLVLVVRGDSEYYILITATNEDVKGFYIIGETGNSDELITFKINDDYTISKYKGQRKNKVFFKRLKILNDGSFKEVRGNTNSYSVINKGGVVYAQVDTYLNMRSAPNTTGTIVGKIYPTDKLMVLEVLTNWVKVSLNGTEGYVSSEFVK